MPPPPPPPFLLLNLLARQAQQVAVRRAVPSVAGARRRDALRGRHLEGNCLALGLARRGKWRSPNRLSSREGGSGLWPAGGDAAGDQDKEEEQRQFGAEGWRQDRSGGGGGHVMTVTVTVARRKGRPARGDGWIGRVQCPALPCPALMLKYKEGEREREREIEHLNTIQLTQQSNIKGRLVGRSDNIVTS